MATPTLGWGDAGVLPTHRGFVSNERIIKDIKRLEIGDILAFMYAAKPRFVMVVHPHWEFKLHALDLSKIDRATLITQIYPRLDVANDPKIFYETVYKRAPLYTLDAYRTYMLPKIISPVTFDYDIPDSADLTARKQFDVNYRGTQ